MSAAITAAVVGVAGSAYNQKQQSKAQKKAAEAQQAAAGGGGEGAAGAANMQSWYDINKVNELNRQNALWAQQQNLVDTQTDFGSTNYTTDPVTGKISAKQSLTPEQQAMLTSLRGKQGEMIGGMESGFNVNNDVMEAMKAQLQPGQDAARNKENARLAAMGLGTGSGYAWGQSQDALNRSQNDANQKAVLGGFDAWQQEQQNNRANLGSLNSTETGWAGNAPKANWSQVAAPNVSTPQNRTFEGWVADQQQANLMYNQEMANAQGEAAGNSQIWGGIGQALGNKDVQSGLGKAWDWATGPSGGSNPNADPNSAAFLGQLNGGTPNTSSGSGFNWGSSSYGTI